MFDIGSSEFLLIVIVAVVVIGPKDLPRALYKVGQIVGKARGMARHFRSGIDAMVREVELEELEKKWAAQNERIMREHAPAPAQIETTYDEATHADMLPGEPSTEPYAAPVQSAFPYDSPAPPVIAPVEAETHEAPASTPPKATSPEATPPKDGAAA